MATSRIAELASIITENTALVDSYIASNGHPTPTFDADAPPRLLLEAAIAKPRQAILEATDELHALMQGPIGIITGQSHLSMISLQAIYRFNIASSFSGEAKYEDISKRCGLAEPETRRILRHAMTYRIFRESSEGIVAHTAASKLLSTNPVMREWVGMVSEELWPAATRTVDAMTRWPGSQEPNQAGFNIAHNTEDSLFANLEKHPERSKRFAGAMRLFSSSEGYKPFHLVDNYPWAAIGKGTVVDVGGSHGLFSLAIAERFPDLHCIVQDRPDIITESAKRLPDELVGRVTFMAHDFFATQPIKNADVYLFRWIFHDWSDKYSIKILRALVPALKNDARIVIHEYVLPKPGTISLYQERSLRGMDLAMLEQSNAKEREVGDWSKLLHDADPRYQFLGVKQPPLSSLGIIEARWECPPPKKN